MASNGPIRTQSESEDPPYESLDVLALSVVGRDGEQKVVPALNIGFMEPREYVAYKALPSLFLSYPRSCSNAEVDEWLERTVYYEEDLTWLLRLPHHRFWSQVIYDEELQICLQSYLTRAPRDYDLNTSVREDVLQRQKHIHKLVFFVFLRMSTYKESKMHYVNSKVFGEIIYDDFLFDVPRMMDLCVLYSFGNQEIMSKMIQNFFTVQPKYVGDLEETLPCMIGAFNSTEERLGLKKSNSTLEKEQVMSEDISSFLNLMHIEELFDIVNYITDISATIYSFLETYPSAADIFYRFHLAVRLPAFYDLVFPILETEMKQRRDKIEFERLYHHMSSKLVLSKLLLIKVFRSIITANCIHPVLNETCSNLKSDNSETHHLNDFLQIFTEVATEKLFLYDYNHLFPFYADLEMFSEAGINIDPASLDYILSTIEPSQEIEKENFSVQCRMQGSIFDIPLPKESAGTLQAVAAKLDSGAFELQQNGDSDFCGTQANSFRPGEIELMSLIQMVCDVIPDVCQGFVEACLENYNFNSEMVIDAILSDTLPPHLEQMDRTTERKHVRSNELVLRDDEQVNVLSERKNIFDNDEFDVFNREDIAIDRIHKGKKNKTPDTYNVLTGGGESSVLKELILQYEAGVNGSETMLESNLYEDEYDDTYDSQDVYVAERQPEFTVRPFTVPVVLRNLKYESCFTEDFEEEEKEEVNEDAEVKEQVEDKDGKSALRNDEFCVNPEILRQQAEQRRQAKFQRRGFVNVDARASPSGSQRNSSFRGKERHKGAVANHNRRKQSDFKRSRGMGGFPN